MRQRAARLGIALACLVLAAGNLHILAARPRGAHLRGHEDLADARLMLLGAALALVWIQPGLWHGKRNAAIIAAVAAGLSVAGDRQPWTSPRSLLVAALVGALVVSHRAFRGRASRGGIRDGVRVLLVGTAVMFVYGVASIYVLDAHFRVTTTLAESMRVTGRLLLLLPPGSVQAITPHGHWLIASVHIGSLIVVLSAVTRFVTAVTLDRHDRDELRVRSILDEWGITALAPFHLLDDKSWVFSDDGRAFVGYTVVGSTAVALGDPVGPAAAWDAVVGAFLSHCARQGWTPSFHQLSDDGRSAVERARLRALKIGEEAIVDVRRWRLDAPQYKSLRSAVRRVERAGLTLVELPQPLSVTDLDQLGDVSEAWMESGGHRERTFTLGRFDPDYLRSTRVLALRDPDERIVAFVNIIPSYRSQVGNFDLMRRRPDSPNGTMEYLFAKLIERFRDEGYAGMSLGFAPLANITGDDLTARALRTLFERGDKAFNFQGLRAFKDKWGPEWVARYLAYPTPADLPAVAVAIARAGELRHHRSLPTRIARAVRRYPVTSAIGTLLIWFGLVAAASRRSERLLVRYLGLRPRDLARLEWWRLPASQLLPSAHWTAVFGIAATIAALAIGERRLGSRMTVVAFFVGDWLSTLPVMAGGVIIHSSTGRLANLVNQRDGGASSGRWALAIVIILALTHPVLRRVLIVGSAVLLVGELAWSHDLAAVQHVVAAVAAVGLWYFLVRPGAGSTRLGRGAGTGISADSMIPVPAPDSQLGPASTGPGPSS